MAFSLNNIAVLAYAAGVTHWQYTTPDTVADVLSPGYFDSAADLLSRGNTITCSTGGPEAGCILFVTGVSGGVVTVRSTERFDRADTVAAAAE